MIAQTQATIYLAEKRPREQHEDCYRAYNSFGQHEQVLVKDVTLAGSKTTYAESKNGGLLILLPVAGKLAYADKQGKRGSVEAGEVVVYDLKAGQALTILNPFEEALIRDLEIWCFSGGAQATPNGEVVSLAIDTKRNRLLALLRAKMQTSGFRAYVGKFDGRQEGRLLVRPENKVFAYVIDGVCEVQNRLLQSGDGLQLTGVDEVEFEALSQEAIVVLMEASATGQ